MFVFCLTGWTCTSLLKSGNTQKSLRCHFTLTGDWKNTRGCFCVREKEGWGRFLSFYQTDLFDSQFLWKKTGLKETQRGFVLLQASILKKQTSLLTPKSLLAWHRHRREHCHSVSHCSMKHKAMPFVVCLLFARIDERLLCDIESQKLKEIATFLFSFWVLLSKSCWWLEWQLQTQSQIFCSDQVVWCTNVNNKNIQKKSS